MNNDYVVLATSQDDDRVVPDTNGLGRPIGSSGRGYTVLAEGSDLGSGELPNEKVNSDEVSLGDVLLDTFHMAGATGDAINGDGTPDTSGDFFGGSDANERLYDGTMKAMGYNSRIKPEYRSDPNEPDTNGGRVRQVIGEMGKGLSDLINAGMIGADTTAADIINFFDSKNAGADDLRERALSREQDLNYPDGAATAVGEEIGSMATTAPIGGKATDLLLGGGKAIGQAVNKATMNRGSRVLDRELNKFNEIRARATKAKTDGEETIRNGLVNGTIDSDTAGKALSKVHSEYDDMIASIPKVGSKDAIKTPQLSLLTELIGKVSPTTKNFIERNYERILATFGNDTASMNRFIDEYNKLKLDGFSDKVIRNKLLRDTIPSKTATDALFKPNSKAGNAIGALLGSDITK
jgi:hypothetical protein